MNRRSVFKNWSKAVLSLYFQTISIVGSRRVKVLIDNWNGDLFEPIHSPVKRLRIDNLPYSEQMVEGVTARDDEDEVCDRTASLNKSISKID